MGSREAPCPHHDGLLVHSSLGWLLVSDNMLLRHCDVALVIELAGLAI